MPKNLIGILAKVCTLCHLDILAKVCYNINTKKNKNERGKENDLHNYRKQRI